MGGWGSLLDRVTSWLPILTPAQRRRANIAKLEQEIKETQSHPWTPALGILVERKSAQLERLRSEAANQ